LWHDRDARSVSGQRTAARGGPPMAEQYDLIVVGGGIAGSSLAGKVAASGASVLILERETEFRDRIRGEWVAPWGVIELERLGTIELLRERANAHDLPRNHAGVFALRGDPEPLAERTKVQRGALSFFHPEAQEALLTWAAEQGAEVIRGARVTAVQGGDTPSVEWSGEGASTAVGWLIVGADGRTSMVRQEIDHPEERHGNTRLWAGVRLTNLNWPSDTGLQLFDPLTSHQTAMFPQQDGSARVYLGFAGEDRTRLSGERDLGTFLAGVTKLFGDRDVFSEAEAVGPLATFEAEMRWIRTPYEDGLAVIGDASGYTDPTFGQGLSLGFRDARVLSEALATTEDWRAAAASYAEEHDRYFDAVVQYETWSEELLLTGGPEADATRARVFPAWGEDRSRNPNAGFDGPDFVADEEARRRYFALDLVE
jgi:2-polyprenyl-6-methoxyphenol hydroxylase-like FAD-dependent oxidoreductase